MNIELAVNLTPLVAYVLWLLWAGVCLSLACFCPMWIQMNLIEGKRWRVAVNVLTILACGYHLLWTGERLAAWMAVLLEG